MTYALEAEQLVKHYTGRGGDVEAVKGVDLHVRRGEVVGFLRPNGASRQSWNDPAMNGVRADPAPRRIPVEGVGT